jgi:hypothetical protein
MPLLLFESRRLESGMLYVSLPASPAELPTALIFFAQSASGLFSERAFLQHKSLLKGASQ